MRAIILAAGRGSRMKSLTDDAPKCLVKFRGRSLLSSQIESLTQGGITEIGIVTGYKRELLCNYGLVEFHNERWSETNMVYSLAQSEEWLLSGPCVVSYSDIYYSKDAVASLVSCSAPLAITYDPNWLELWNSRFANPLEDAETFRLRGDSLLAEIGGKPQTVDEVQGQYMGLLRFTPESWQEARRVLGELPNQVREGVHMTGTLQRIVEAGKIPVTAIAYSGEWYEFDTISDLNAAEE